MMKVIKFFCFLFACFAALNVFAAEVNLDVDKDVMTEGDTLYLTIEYSGDDDSSPNLTSLQRDFRIVSNSSSQQFQYINGQMSQSKKWTLGLKPRRTGKIKISPIKVGGLLSNSVDVEVKEVTDVAYVPDSRENSNSPYFQIEMKADNPSPYVQQQMHLFVNVYDSIGIQDGAINISEEAKKNWIIVPLLSKPKVRQETINHKRLNVVTYAFAIFPQKSGKIDLPQFVFEGYYVKNTDFGFPNFNDDLTAFGFNFRNIFGQTVPVLMKTKVESVDVKPIPADFSGQNWLPLDNLEISGNWSVKNGFKVGDAVSRTVELTAYGITESMIPQIKFPDVDGFNQYPEKPVTSEKVMNGQLVTLAKVNNVYIPTKSGNFTIPETKITWFNTRTNKKEVTVLPQENIFVLPNSDIETESKQNSISPVSEKKEPAQNPKQVEKESQNDSSKTDAEDFFKFIKNNIYLSSFILLALLFIIYRCFSPKKKNYTLRNDVIRAIKAHDYKKAKEALLIWANDKFYPADINNFNDIIRMVKDESFAESLSALNKVLYSDSLSYFDDAKFIEVLKKVDKIRYKEDKKTEALPNLYD